MGEGVWEGRLPLDIYGREMMFSLLKSHDKQTGILSHIQDERAVTQSYVFDKSYFRTDYRYIVEVRMEHVRPVCDCFVCLF